MFLHKIIDKSGGNYSVTKTVGSSIDADEVERLKRLLYKNKIEFSVKRASELTYNMYQLNFVFPDSQLPKKFLLKMDSEQ